MARQQQGANAITIWMIVFVALWLTSTVFLVILYTGLEDINSDNTRLTAANERAVSERQAEARNRQQIAELAIGDPEGNAALVRSRRDELTSRIRTERLVAGGEAYPGLSLHDGLSRLYSAFREEANLRRSAETRLAELEAEKAQLVEATAAAKASLDSQAQDLRNQWAQLEARWTEFRQERNEAVSQLEREFDERRSLNDAELTRERQSLAACREQLSVAQERFRTMQARLGGLMTGPEELATARQPDGKILKAVPGDPVVYINLGARNSLTLGLQFAVYSSQTGIPADGRSKAQIEVVSISPDSAECRIVAVARNEVVLEGDLIANPVYDPHHAMNFVVIGEFDLDRDGTLDRDGAAAVEALILRFGGRVQDSIDPLTDFVVVGASPRRPRPAGEIPPDQLEQNRLREAMWSRYNETLSTARNLSIPVLTQEVFLNFLGYNPRFVQR